jgi:gas vesicle protein
MSNSKKIPYFLAAGAIGGAVGYLFFTDSGKNVIDKISRLRVEKSAKIAEKIEDARMFIADKGKDVTSVLHHTVDRVKGSIAAGHHAYGEAGDVFHGRVEKVHRNNAEVVGNLHRAVDNIGKLMQTVQDTFLEPLFEVGAFARGVDRGVRELVNNSGKSFARKSISIYKERTRA